MGFCFTFVFSAALKDFGEYCTNDSQCNSMKNLACLNFNGVSHCGCVSARYWNGSSCRTLLIFYFGKILHIWIYSHVILESLGLINAICNSTSHCDSKLGLDCSNSLVFGNCVCNSSSYWTGSYCGNNKSQFVLQSIMMLLITTFLSHRHN